MPVANLKTYQLEADCLLPDECPTDIKLEIDILVRPEEEAALLKAGVWRKDDGTDNWAKQAPDGSVWAGNLLEKGRMIAKVRAKDGRRMGGGNKPKAVKRMPTSLTLLPEEKAKLEDLAAKATDAAGIKVSSSMFVSGMLAIADGVMPQVVDAIKAQAANQQRR